MIERKLLLNNNTEFTINKIQEIDAAKKSLKIKSQEANEESAVFSDEYLKKLTADNIKLKPVITGNTNYKTELRNSYLVLAAFNAIKIKNTPDVSFTDPFFPSHSLHLLLSSVHVINQQKLLRPLD